MKTKEENKILSIGVLTWNMAEQLEKTLSNIISQALRFKNEVEICISNNGSTDNTRDIVMKFKEKYPNITIKYNENKENLGIDRNIIKVVDLAEGKFVWIFGDDEIAENGLKEVIEFIKKQHTIDLGLIVLRREAYYFDDNGDKIIYANTCEDNKSKIFELDRTQVVGGKFTDSSFIPVLLLNNQILKKIFKDENELITQGIGTCYIHVLWYKLMFLKYPTLKCWVINKHIINQPAHFKYRFIVEDEFNLSYRSSKIADILLYSKYSKGFENLIVIVKRKEKFGFILHMIIAKAFSNFNYNSYSGCIKSFFSSKSSKSLAILYSASFIFLSLTPPIISRKIYEIFLKIKHGKRSNDIFNNQKIAYTLNTGKEKRRIYH
ncbi:hypothetical protein BEH94_06795 [Candidatus Altiarchaeales archaeon WOR_SM1_SCG]|nr:hypothetical protein BEH94_06795 [Candidatus Altiarchaeales archaeon WOR_SM1_SCG]